MTGILISYGPGHTFTLQVSQLQVKAQKNLVLLSKSKDSDERNPYSTLIDPLKEPV